MARSYAKIYVTVWGSDFRTLTRGAQHLYFQLVSNPKLNAAGCVTIQPRKWAGQSSDATAAGVAEALSELVATRYVLTDDDTEELLVRSFIHHDRGYRNKFLLKSIETAIEAIESPSLREHARLELAAALEPASPQLEDSEQDSYEDAYEDPSQATYEANYSLQPQLHPATSPTDLIINGAQVPPKLESVPPIPDDDEPKNHDKKIADIIDAIIAKRSVHRHVADPISHMRASRANFAAKERLTLDMVLATRPHFLEPDANPATVAEFYIGHSAVRAATGAAS